jgi:hypothetical protein
MSCGRWGYTNDGCRCAECTEAHSRNIAEYRKRLRAMLAENPDIAPHGTLSTYSNYGCRCQPCQQARADARKAAQ